MPDHVVPYSKIAPFYDELMQHVNYKLWAKFIKKLLAYYQIKPGIIIDLSCGTGSIFKYLLMEKWNFIGSDLSFDMIDLARDKVSAESVNLFCADFREIPIRENTINVALILYDSLNYLLEDNDIIPFFDQVYSILKDNGLFIFDVVTPYICKKAFSNYKEEKFWENTGYARKAWYNSKDSIQYNDFTIRMNQMEYHELHEQKIRPQDEWTEWIKECPFQLVGAFSNFSMRKAHKRTERIHFVCRKPRSR